MRSWSAWTGSGPPRSAVCSYGLAAPTGFSSSLRLFFEFLIAGIAVFIFITIGDKSLSQALAVPFFKDVLIQFGYFFIIVGAIVVVAAGNAVNITDGLDGLAIVPVMIAAATYGLIAYLVGNAVFADYLQVHNVKGTGELAVLCGAVVGAARRRGVRRS